MPQETESQGEVAGYDYSAKPFADSSAQYWCSQIDLQNRQPILGGATDGTDAHGVPVRLPSGEAIPYAGGYLMGRTADDLKTVADAGRQFGQMFRAVYSSGIAGPAKAMVVLGVGLGVDFGYAGTFDYQREGSLFFGYTPHRQFEAISNVNIGVFAAQAGLPLEDILWTAGLFAYASHWATGAPDYSGYSYLNSPTNTSRIRLGYELGKSKF
jgi:hypothetical protein